MIQADTITIPVAPAMFRELLTDVVNASFECGEWSSSQADERYEVVQARSQKAQDALTEWTQALASSDHRRGVRTFDELFADHNLTLDEREHLVAYLAFMRSRATIKALSSKAAG